MPARDAITPAVLRELLEYDPETGSLTWKERVPRWFAPSLSRSAEHICALWNARYAGTRALAADKGDGYLRGPVLGVHVAAHRAAWAIFHGEWPPGTIDHADGDPTNNRIGNLRCVTVMGNAMNRRAYRKKSDLPAGVKHHPKKAGKAFQARIRANGVPMSLGYFENADEAHAAYLSAADRHGFTARHGTRG